MSDVTADLARRRGLELALLPVTDDPHPTVVVTPEGPLDFQDYFVRGRASAEVVGVEFPGAVSASPAAGVLEALAAPDVVIVAPSNPFVSIEPILVVPGVSEALRDTEAPVVAVSPIVGGEAVKGPAAAMMRTLGHEVSALGVARLYAGLVDVFVLDEVDGALAPAVEAARHAGGRDRHDDDEPRTAARARLGGTRRRSGRALMASTGASPNRA